MKVIKFFAISLVVASSFVMSVKIKPLDLITPKGADLLNHFGTEPNTNIYGPSYIGPKLLQREGVSGPDTPVKPITNFDQEIDPSKVVSGDLLNTSFDAGKIITPQYAGKLNI